MAGNTKGMADEAMRWSIDKGDRTLSRCERAQGSMGWALS